MQAYGERTAPLEDLQLTQGQGPSADASLSSTIVLVPDLVALDPTRWPGLPGPALELGVRATFAFPLRIGIVTIGVLTGHRTTPGPMTPDQLTAALILADLLAQYVTSHATDADEASRLLDSTSLHFAEVTRPPACSPPNSASTAPRPWPDCAATPSATTSGCSPSPVRSSPSGCAWTPTRPRRADAKPWLAALSGLWLHALSSRVASYYRGCAALVPGRPTASRTPSGLPLRGPPLRSRHLT
ncbi:GAF domain-containing protein [Streptomyces lasiicapitis]|uniref:GAF domain-containing protein n=1 Tax=Streptomyces lasiicapitis TaxID=1923961 RepID=UPI0036AFEE9E